MIDPFEHHSIIKIEVEMFLCSKKKQKTALPNHVLGEPSPVNKKPFYLIH